MRLTDLTIRALPFEEDGQRDYADHAVIGLSVRVGRRSKTFMLVLRRGGKRERVRLGPYDPPHFTLSMARERARDLIAEARLNKPATPVSPTFKEALEQFKAMHIPGMRPGSQKNARRVLKKFPQLEPRRLSDITSIDLATALDRFTAPSERLNIFIYLRVFFNWCYRRGYIEQNPVWRLKAPPAPRPRERVLSNSEIITVWNAAGEDNFGAFIRLLILTAQRKGQWYAFRPEFIQADTIVFPGACDSADSDDRANDRQLHIHGLQRGQAEARTSSVIHHVRVDPPRPASYLRYENGGVGHCPTHYRTHPVAPNWGDKRGGCDLQQSFVPRRNEIGTAFVRAMATNASINNGAYRWHNTTSWRRRSNSWRSSVRCC
jgi:hypothetical protein